MDVPKIDKPLVVYIFYCMALFHSQTRRHMINSQFNESNSIYINETLPSVVSDFCQHCLQKCLSIKGFFYNRVSSHKVKELSIIAAALSLILYNKF